MGEAERKSEDHGSESGTKTSPCICEYLIKRDKWMKEDKSYGIGAKVELNCREMCVNQYLMQLKHKELDNGFKCPKCFSTANHFFQSKHAIDDSKVFRFIQLMPKGASLHTHDTGLVSGEYLYKLTYRDNLYGRIRNCMVEFRFFDPAGVPENEEWELIKELRENDCEFDTFLRCRLTMIRSDPTSFYKNEDCIWRTFQNLCLNLEGLITYKPVFEDYFYQFLQEAFDENVKYLEFRGYVPDVYDIDGTTYKGVKVIDIYDKIVTKFQRDHHSFFGCQFIFAPHRIVDKEQMQKYVRFYLKIKKKFPRFVLGFDLSGREDNAPSLLCHINELLFLKQKDTKFFFSAGETKWNGHCSDENLFDAILLGTVRIGHGFAIVKHPFIGLLCRCSKIGIEISPIASQVFRMCDDIRDHPGAVMIANNYPVVIVNDNPLLWGAKGLSYDWYLAFMGMAHRDADLRMLKQLALNSIEFSGLEPADKYDCKVHFECEWDNFIIQALKGCKCFLEKCPLMIPGNPIP